jgi:hypothetical protein
MSVSVCVQCCVIISYSVLPNFNIFFSIFGRPNINVHLLKVKIHRHFPKLPSTFKIKIKIRKQDFFWVMSTSNIW